jgi:hypothetical protein
MGVWANSSVVKSGVAPVQWRDYDLVMEQILRVAYPLSNATGLSVSESAVVG